jgi:hypothetical protein
MPEMIRVKVNWTGFVGGPGYTNLHFEPTVDAPITQAIVDAAVAKTQTFITSLRMCLPTTVTIGIDPAVVEIDEVTGNLETYWTAAVAATQVGADPTVYSAASGAVINWYTNEVRNGRRVRGRTFLVPLGGGQYDAQGTIAAAKITDFQNMANALSNDATAARLVVWKRPTEDPDLGTLPDGGAYNVTSYSVPDMAAILRSRRD